MKYLKKILVLSLLILTIFACGSDDDDDFSNGTDPTSIENLEKIIGTWIFTSRSTNGVPNEIEDPCELFNTFVFTSNQVSIQEHSGETCSEVISTSEGYDINVDILTVGDFTVIIITLNDTTLIVKYQEEGNTITESFTKL